MNDQITPTPSAELDLDDWLATGERTSHHVYLYARMDLIADIERLEAKIPEDQREAPKSDGALGGDYDEYAEERAQIRDLYQRIDASKRVFRVTSQTQQEIDALRDKVAEELAEEIDKAAAKGRKEAHRDAKRMGVTNANELNALMRNGAKEEADALLRQEATVRMIAASTTAETSEGSWANLSIEQVRTLGARLGDAQMGRLADAALRAHHEVPEVTVPKS